MKIFTAVLICCTPLLLAQDNGKLPAKSSALLKQYNDYEEQKVKNLKADLLKVKKQVIVKLKKHLQETTKAGNLDGSQALIARIKKLESDVAADEKPVAKEDNNKSIFAKTTEFVLKGKSKRWVNTRVKVRKGQTVTIKCKGEVGLSTLFKNVVCDADGINNKAFGLHKRFDTGRLLGRLSSAQDDILPLGTEESFKVKKNGTLQLTINDANLNDNTGKWEISITVK